MHNPDSIEAALAKLMPPALSPDFQSDLETMLDELSAEVTPVKRRVTSRWVVGGGVAAVLAAVAALFPVLHDGSRAGTAVTSSEKNGTGLVLVGESDRIESMTEEGWRENSDGSAMRAVRLNVVAENSLQDEETGIVMQVSEPREEILLMPITSF